MVKISPNNQKPEVIEVDLSFSEGLQKTTTNIDSLNNKQRIEVHKPGRSEDCLCLSRVSLGGESDQIFG
ncbi:MAG: hypothetical protein QNJ32_23545 [Xenococcaceae cyanobacterium MO_167.B27]|nr:hypothetical protein [Xenococcaceae cyanobacterium MO_167.B27]